jgi:hypothetical protein
LDLKERQWKLLENKWDKNFKILEK